MSKEKLGMGDVVGPLLVALRVPSDRPTTGGQSGPLQKGQHWS